MLVKEESLLEPRDPSLQNADDWPSFPIKNIRVTSQKTGKDVSLLSAHPENVVNVSGKLDQIDDELLHLVRDKKYKDKAIEVSNVMTYAFAEYQDGTYGFWAAGKAGWFEIQSASNAYQETYDKMNEEASMFYMLADKLKRSHNPHPKLSRKRTDQYANQVFQDYLSRGQNFTSLNDVDDVREAFHEHRQYLMTSMLDDQEGLNWNGSPMLNYFKWKFPDDFSNAAARIPAKEPTALQSIENNSDRPRKRKSQSPEDSEASAPKRRKRGRPRSSEIQQPHTPITDSNPGISPSGDDERGAIPNVVTRKRKSILQPSGGKYSKKAAGRRKGPAAMTSANDSQAPSDEELAADDSPITTLRNAKDLELLTNPPTNRLTPDPDDHPPSPKFLPRKYLELKVVSYDLPSTDPQGPGDLWTCTFEGCYHRVHEASTAAGKKRIKEHFKTHATQAQEKIDLVLDESRPYLPVNNLVRRLQAFASGPDEKPGPDSLERKFSAPFRRRY